MKKITTITITIASLLTTMTIASNIKASESYIEKSKNIQELQIINSIPVMFETITIKAKESVLNSESYDNKIKNLKTL